MIARRRCRRIHPYVDEGVAQQLDIHCASSGATVSAVVDDALREHLERTGAITGIMLRLDRIGRRVERTHRDLELFMEAFGIWVKIWFAHMPRIDRDDQEIAARQAESRFAEFVDEVAQDCSSGHHFLDDVWRAVLARRADHSPAVAQASTAIRGPDASGQPRDA
jgi:hypothetical protein